MTCAYENKNRKSPETIQKEYKSKIMIKNEYFKVHNRCSY